MFLRNKKGREEGREGERERGREAGRNKKDGESPRTFFQYWILESKIPYLVLTLSKGDLCGSPSAEDVGSNSHSLPPSSGSQLSIWSVAPITSELPSYVY